MQLPISCDEISYLNSPHIRPYTPNSNTFISHESKEPRVGERVDRNRKQEISTYSINLPRPCVSCMIHGMLNFLDVEPTTRL